MKNKILQTILAALAFICLVWPTISNAQIQIRAMPSLSIPLGDNMNAYSLNGGIGIYGHFLLKEKLGIGAGTGYYALSTGYAATYSGVIPIVASFEYNFLTGKVIPYLGADLGGYIWRASGGFAIGGVSATNLNLRAYFGFALRGGVSYFFSEKFGLNLELKNNFILTNTNNGTNNQDIANIFTPALGVTLRLGGGK